MPIKWGEQADARLLVGIITLHSFKLDHKALAEFMGQDCTASAIQHRVQRIKEMVRNSSPTKDTAAATSPGSATHAEEEDGDVAPDSTPTKPKRGRPAKRGTKSSGGPACKRVKAQVNEVFS
ncbi:hypothetical protein BDV23DRAFT_185527 [Aspergillus alliaceus]|uniref:AT hook motif protein n=1 Tax=Petromyces alliaceus TaxID=209559 RepID=A0A5N7C3M1_PETAA|nr:hypothetical protein BDV23DRAFT_185527 [Aspergillus alliaceus]